MAKKRNSVSQIAVWIILGLLIVGLMGFGATSFVGNNSAVASVGDRDIDANRYFTELQQEINRMSQQFGAPLTFQQAQLFGVDQAVLGRLIATAALENEATEAGISAGDENVRDELLTIPGFQGVDGSFDREGYAFALRQSNLTEAEFEQQVRSDLSRRVLTEAVIGGAQAPGSLVDALLTYANEGRDVTWTVLAPEDLETPISEPTDEALRAHWTENEDAFMLPETRDITYVWLTPAMLAETIEADDAALQALYEAREASYNQPERRLVERLLFASPADAEAAAAALEAGETTFEDLVAERGLDLADIDLGDMSEAALGDAGADVFALEGPGIAGPVETDLGPAIFRMNGILAPTSVSFDEARPELLAAYRLEESQRAVGDWIEAVDDLLAGGATLEEVADETELELGQIAWAEGATEAVAALPEFRQAALRATEEDFPEVQQAADGSLFALRLNAITPPMVEPFDDAREAVEADWRRVTTVLALSEQARALAGEMQDVPRPDADALGTDLLPLGVEEDTEETTEGPDYQAEDGLLRTDVVPDTPTQFVERIFAMDEGEIIVIDGETAAYVVRLDAITPPDLTSDENAPRAEALRAQLSGSVSQDILEAFAAAVQNEAGISINQSTLNAVHLGFGGGHGGQ